MDSLRRARMDLIQKFLFERLTRDWETAKTLSITLLNKLEDLETKEMDEYYRAQEEVRTDEMSAQTHLDENYAHD